jgi:hypothetical protein
MLAKAGHRLSSNPEHYIFHSRRSDNLRPDVISEQLDNEQGQRILLTFTLHGKLFSVLISSALLKVGRLKLILYDAVNRNKVSIH